MAVLAMPKMETGGQSILEVPVSGKVAMAAIEWPAVAQQRVVEVRDKIIVEDQNRWSCS